MERKDFIKAACGLCALAMVPAYLAGCKKTDTSAPTANFTVDLSLATYAALNTTGGSQVVNGILIIHSAASGFVAVQADCTHQGCAVNYNASGNDILCPCHSGVFDINGAVVSGPPPSALHKYTVTQNGTVLSIA